MNEAGLALAEDNEKYIPLIYFDETLISSIRPCCGPSRTGINVLALGDMYRGLGIGRNCMKKMQIMCEMLNGSLSCDFVVRQCVF